MNKEIWYPFPDIGRTMQMSRSVFWWFLHHFLLLCVPSPGQHFRGIFSHWAYLKLSFVFSLGQYSPFLTACVFIVFSAACSFVCGLCWSLSTNHKGVACQLEETCQRVDGCVSSASFDTKGSSGFWIQFLLMPFRLVLSHPFDYLFFWSRARTSQCLLKWIKSWLFNAGILETAQWA